MTPTGETVRQYIKRLDTSPWGRGEEAVAQDLEGKLGRMAGVRGIGGVTAKVGPRAQRFVRGRATMPGGR